MTDNKFFENLLQLIPNGGVVRMVITREGEEFLITSELKKDVNAGFASPLFHRGHWSVLDQQFWPKLAEGVTELKGLIFDKAAAIESAGGKTKDEAPAVKTGRKPADKPAKEVVKEETKAPDLLSASGLAEGETADEGTGEITSPKLEEAAKQEEPVNTVVESAPAPEPVVTEVAKEWNDSLLDPAKDCFRAKDYEGALELLMKLKAVYPNTAIIVEKITNVKSKLPPPPPKDEDF